MYAINPELCTFCKSCMEECPTGAIQEGAVVGKEVCVVSSECIACGGCETRCPFGVPVVERMEKAKALFG